jgi:hypothetical protein
MKHKEPKVGSKEYLEHETKEITQMEAKERKEDPDHEKKEQKGMDGMHLKHPQLKGEQKSLMNDLAYHLHHPQLGLKGAKLPPSNPKGKVK